MQEIDNKSMIDIKNDKRFADKFQYNSKYKILVS